MLPKKDIVTHKWQRQGHDGGSGRNGPKGVVKRFALGRDEVGRTTQCPIVKLNRGLVGQKAAGGQRLTGITSEAERLANSHMAWQAHDPGPIALCSAVVMLTGYIQSGGIVRFG